jgi:hypothetical protein
VSIDPIRGRVTVTNAGTSRVMPPGRACRIPHSGGLSAVWGKLGAAVGRRRERSLSDNCGRRGGWSPCRTRHFVFAHLRTDLLINLGTLAA